jgi:glycosyltransferase involved in cell wall biosynthesis
MTAAVAGARRVERNGRVFHHRVRVHVRSDGPLAGVPAARALSFAAAMWREVCRVRDEHGVDVVVAPLYAGAGLLCACDDRPTTVTRLFTPIELDRRLRPSMGDREAVWAKIGMERAAVLRARHVQAATHAICDDVAAWLGARLPDPLLIPLGVRDRRPDPGRVERAPDDEQLQVLFVGRLERRKGVDVLLQAARRLVAELPEVRFVLAGPDSLLPGPVERYREEFLAAAGGDRALLERVRFEGEVSDERLWELYAGCDVFCAPSLYESFGNVLIEAMMFGKPVVASRAGGMPEVVEDGVNGVLVEPGDVESLQRALRGLLLDAGRRAELGAAGRRRWTERFRLDAVAELTHRRYRELPGASELGSDGLAARVAEAVGEVTGLDGHTARAAAAELLDRAEPERDPAAEIDALWLEPPEAFVAGLYRVAFAREPDPQEIGGWRAALSGGLPRLEVAERVLGSAEAAGLGVDRAIAGHIAARLRDHRVDRVLGAWEAPDAEFVRVLFLAVLGRDPGRRGLSDWLRALYLGTPRLEVARALAESDEARRSGAATDWLDRLPGRIATGEPAVRSR